MNQFWVYIYIYIHIVDVSHGIWVKFFYPTPNLQILSSNGACLYLKLKGAAKTKNYGKPASCSKPMDLSQEKEKTTALFWGIVKPIHHPLTDKAWFFEAWFSTSTTFHSSCET